MMDGGKFNLKEGEMQRVSGHRELFEVSGVVIPGVVVIWLPFHIEEVFLFPRTHILVTVNKKAAGS